MGTVLLSCWCLNMQGSWGGSVCTCAKSGGFPEGDVGCTILASRTTTSGGCLSGVGTSALLKPSKRDVGCDTTTFPAPTTSPFICLRRFLTCRARAFSSLGYGVGERTRRPGRSTSVSKAKVMVPLRSLGVPSFSFTAALGLSGWAADDSCGRRKQVSTRCPVSRSMSDCNSTKGFVWFWDSQSA